MRKLLLGMEPAGHDLKVDLGMRRIKLSKFAVMKAWMDSKHGQALCKGLEPTGTVPAVGS